MSGSRIGKGEPGSGQVREWGAGDRDVGLDGGGGHLVVGVGGK